MLSCAEEGILTQDTNPNAEPYEVKKSIHLCVANETMEEQNLIVKWTLRNNRSEILRGGEEAVTAAPLSSVWLAKQDCMDADTYGDYVSYECFRDGELISGGCVIFCAPKHYRFVDPKLTVTAEGDVLTVKANAYARGVEIINEADDMLLEDNYFDMNAGAVSYTHLCFFQRTASQPGVGKRLYGGNEDRGCTYRPPAQKTGFL